MIWANVLACAVFLAVAAAAIIIAVVCGEYIYREGEAAGIVFGQGKIPAWADEALEREEETE